MDSLLQILPNLSIGVVAIIGLVLVIRWFLQALQTIITASQKALLERESALRSVEADVRRNLTEVLTKATIALESNSRVLGRVMNKLDVDFDK